MIQLTEKEKEIFSDREFLISKIDVIDKIQSLFEIVRAELHQLILSSGIQFSASIDTEIGKIFKGENYNSLPYVLLDYPKLFSDSDTFVLRTMFWWGNFFSTTLHLEGKSLESYRQIIFSNSSKIIDKNIFICVNNTPWHYHYQKDNYILLQKSNIELINSVKFLKLSNKFDLDQYDKMPYFASNFLQFFIDILK